MALLSSALVGSLFLFGVSITAAATTKKKKNQNNKKNQAFTDAEHIFFAAVFGDSPATTKQWQCEVCSKFCEEYEWGIKSKLVGDEDYYDAIMDAVDNITNTFSALTDSAKAQRKMSAEHLEENPGRGKYAWKIHQRHFVDVQSSAMREEELEADEDMFYRVYVEPEANKKEQQQDPAKKKKKMETMKRDILNRFQYVPRQLMNDFIHEEVHTHILTDYNVQVVLHALQAAAHMDRPTQLPLPFCRRQLCEEVHGTVPVCPDPHKDGGGGFRTPYDHLTENYEHFLHQYGHDQHYDAFQEHTGRGHGHRRDDEYDEDIDTMKMKAREQEEQMQQQEQDEMIRRHNARGDEL